MSGCAHPKNTDLILRVLREWRAAEEEEDRMMCLGAVPGVRKEMAARIQDLQDQVLRLVGYECVLDRKRLVDQAAPSLSELVHAPAMGNADHPCGAPGSVTHTKDCLWCAGTPPREGEE